MKRIPVYLSRDELRSILKSLINDKSEENIDLIDLIERINEELQTFEEL